jgi:glycyl-tRNA synthetase beta chain
LERTQRVARLAEKIAREMGVDPQPAVRAATLAKADLLSGMVGEFPELQGIMGRYYALHDGESEQVAQAVAQHYQPRFAGDALPAYPYGCALALADKLETLSGIWGIGQQPTGDKDPFALRRHALGVTRMLIETVRGGAGAGAVGAGAASKSAEATMGLAFSLTEILQWSFDGLAGLTSVKADVPGLRAFVLDRVRSYFKDKGFAPAHIEACLSAENADSPTAFRLDSLTQRLAAVQSFALLPEAQALAAANKRIGNILKKNDVHQGDALSSQVDPGRLIEPAERALFEAISSTAPLAQTHYASGDFERSLSSLAALRAPVDQFFEQVMVMAEDAAVRQNRLHMLSQLHATMNRVADLALLS